MGLSLGLSDFEGPLVIEEAPEEETGVAGEDGAGDEKLGIETGVGGGVRPACTVGYG